MRPSEQGAPKLKVAVVGGGLAGLSTAVELLDQGYDVEIYEQRPFIGGKVLSCFSCSSYCIELLPGTEALWVTPTSFVKTALSCRGVEYR